MRGIDGMTVRPFSKGTSELRMIDFRLKIWRKNRWNARTWTDFNIRI